ncbi:hypothetical protein [Enterococcus casseliflavus]|uniref:hypothetical protein n=1 Tax=Enterococcus casseliflavus TaxID=37734 RepID=UPI00301865FC
MDTKKEMFLRQVRSHAKSDASRLVMILKVKGATEIISVSGGKDMLQKAKYVEDNYDDYLTLTKGVSIVSYCVA